jgi:hypothetical protein
LYGEQLLASRPTSKLEDEPFSAIRSYPPYWSSIRILKTRHAVVTGAHFSPQKATNLKDGLLSRNVGIELSIYAA